LQQPGDDPDCPYVIVAAPTGTAAANVRGQTMHSAFNFSWGNVHFSLSDKVRDSKRNLLKNLKLVIVDEISMVKSDQQYQLDKRLKEVTQKIEKLFGNVAIFYVGDVMQLKLCKGRYIFDEPINPDYKIDYQLGSYWQSFEVIILEQNHRQ
jgi:ATP-dependent DNA helicase PIF1